MRKRNYGLLYIIIAYPSGKSNSSTFPEDAKQLPSMHQAFEKFLRFVEPWLPGYSTVNVSAFGVKEGQQRTLLGARVHLNPVWLDKAPNTAQTLDDSIFW